MLCDSFRRCVLQTAFLILSVFLLVLSGFSQVDQSLLFHTESKFQRDLDGGNISEELGQVFESNGISLSGDTAVSIIQQGSMWLITDKDKRYIVRRGEGKLNVHGGSYPLPSRLGEDAGKSQEAPVDLRITPPGVTDQESKKPVQSETPATSERLELAPEAMEAEKRETDTEKAEEAEAKVDQPREPRLKRFGYDYFEGARNRILKLETTLGDGGPPPASIQDAISGFVGPIDMMRGNVDASVPHSRILRPGDRLTLIFWSEQSSLDRREVVVDQQGNVILPEVGILVVRGMTLDQFEQAAQDALSRKQFTDLKLIATLDELHTIQIFINGDAFRPGSYFASTVTTLFNALYLSGGPSENGALRDIRLHRNGGTTVIDFYNYLMEGDSNQDIPLIDGDAIFIGPVGRLVSIEGEVKRPGIYELMSDEDFRSLIKMAGGLRPSGFAKRLQIDSVLLNQERVLQDLDFSTEPPPNPPLYDGDRVRVLPILDEVLNVVYLEGKVKRSGVLFSAGLKFQSDLDSGNIPEKLRQVFENNGISISQNVTVSIERTGSKWLITDGDAKKTYSVRKDEGKLNIYRFGIYEFTPGMKISDLIAKAEGVSGKAYLPRADLFRLNDDEKTTTLIPINLAKALNNDEVHNIRLNQRDRLVVYSKREVQWIADRIASVQGAVQNSGAFERSDNMHISDLLIRAGGVLPEAYLEQATLFRLNERRQIAEGIPVNLEAALQKEPATDLLLRDGDTLLVQQFDEVRWVPDREVTITGAVQSPGTYPRLDNMRVSELLFQAGSLLPEASTTALLLRRNERWEVAESLIIDLAGALEKQPQADITLHDGDNLIVYTEEERQWEAPREVSITGAVQLPGVYPRVDDMRISDLLFRAGGVLPNAHLERANLQRYLADQERLESISLDLNKVMTGDPAADLQLQDRDALIVSTIREAAYYPERVVTVYGAVQRPDTYIRTENMRVLDLLFVAGGALPGARETIEVARARGDGQTTIISVNLAEVYQGNPTQNIPLDDQDIVTVPKKQDFRDVPLTVRIEGQVKYPGVYAIQKDDRLSDLIERVGGLTADAFPEGATFTREREKLIESARENALKRTWEEIEAEKQHEYIRQLAKSRLSIQQVGAVNQLSSIAGIASVAEPSLSALADEPVMTPLTDPSALEGKGTDSISQLSPEQQNLASQFTSVQPGQTDTRQTQILPSALGAGINLVTPARKIENLIPTRRIILDLPHILDNPGGSTDLLLEEGDELFIPRIRPTVLVTGAVIYAASYPYQKGKKLEDYVQMAGGYAKDADQKAVYVLKANGLAFRLKKVEQIDKGDVIVVPTRVMVEKISDRWGQALGILRLTIAAATTIFLIDRLTK